MTDKQSKQNKPQDDFEILGVTPGSSFEEIQKARDERLEEVKDDPLMKAKIESSYDAILMSSLKARQQGSISGDAVNASLKEKNVISNVSIKGANIFNLIKNISNKINTDSSLSSSTLFSNSYQRTIRILLGLLAVVIVLIAAPRYYGLILSISTLGLFLSLVKNGNKFIASIGWSVVCLSIGIILGDIIGNSFISSTSSNLTFTIDRVETLSAVIFLWLGSLLIG